MTDLRTISPDELATLSEIPADLHAVVFSPGGPLQAVQFEKLLTKLIAADLAKATKAALDADLAHSPDSVALVFADSTPALNGWYRKLGASGAGSWEQFEELARNARIAAEAAVSAASGHAVAANTARLRASNARGFETRAQLLEATGMQAGDRSAVTNSSGTTHDALSGEVRLGGAAATVGEPIADEGEYLYTGGPLAWRRIGDLDSQVAAQSASEAQAVLTSLDFEVDTPRFVFGKQVSHARGDVENNLGDAISVDGVLFAQFAIRGVSGVSFERAADGYYEIDAGGLQFDVLGFGNGSEVDSTVTRYHDGLKVIRAWADEDGAFASLIERADGSIYIPKLVAPGFSPGVGEGSDDGLVLPTRFLMPLGDSMTAFGYADLVAADLGLPLITPSSVSNNGTTGTAGGGIGSQTADQIAARFGAVPLTCTVAGNELVAGANTLLTISIALLSRASDAAGSIRTLRASMQTLAGATITGTLRCIQMSGGEITYATQAYRYTFTPDEGQILGALPATVWLRIDPEGRDKALLLCWVGRNNVGQPGWQDEVKKRIAAIVRQHKPAAGRFVVIGVTNSRTEPSGSANHTAIVQLNRDLADTYPDNFLDIRPFFNVGEATDIPAASLAADDIHYNTTTGRSAIAAAVTGFILGKGWLS